MTTRAVYIDRGFPELEPDQTAAWEAWCALHGLPDKFDMPLHQTIFCDDTDRTITCIAFVRDDNGKLVLHRNEAVTREVVVQLQAPAQPFPGGYWTGTAA